MLRFDRLGKSLLGAMSVGAIACGSAAAQSESLFVRDRNISVQERERPEYEAPGIRAAQLIFRPRIDVGVGWSSNIFAISDIDAEEGIEALEEEADVLFFVRPSVRADTDWNRHQMSAGAYSELTVFREFDSETVINSGVFLDGRYDVTRASNLSAGVRYDRLNESRRVNNTAFLSDEPVDYDRTAAFAQFARERGRVLYKARFDTQVFDYDDVDLFREEDGVLTELPQNALLSRDQDFRDRTAYEMTGEVGVAVTRDTAAFVSVSANTQQYDDPTTVIEGGETIVVGPERDSDGYRVTAGLDVDFTRLLRGRVGVGYFEQTFDDDAFEDNAGVAVTGALEWFPSPITTVTMTAERGADQSAVFVAGGFVRTELLFEIDHELRRNLILSAYGGFGFDRYDDPLFRTVVGPAPEGTPETEEQEIDRAGFGLGADWLLNPYASAAFDYTYESQDVARDVFDGGFDTDYDVHQAIVTLTLKR